MDRDENDLDEESLVYYKNIEFLKEITRQATALMSRSNSIYRNILTEPKQKMTSHSGSTASVLLPPDPTLCATCGVSHKVDFCILQEILNEERNQKMNDEFHLKEDKTAVPLRPRRGKITDDKIASELPMFHKQLSPEELKSYHELISTRYGHAAGDRFLLARSLLYSGKGEKWDQVIAKSRFQKSQKATQVNKIYDECVTKTPILTAALCSECSSTTLEKMNKVLELRPPCVNEGPSIERNWKLMFERSRFLRESEQKKEVQEKVLLEAPEQEDLEVCTCQRLVCICEPGEICIEPPSKKVCCELIENTALNNHLATLRLAKQQEHPNYEQLDLDTVTESIVKDGVDLYALHSRMYAEQINFLGRCLDGCRPDNENPDEARDFENDLKLIIRNEEQPDEDQWHRWIDHYRLRKIEDSIIADSLDGSTILTKDSQRSVMLEDDHVDVREKSKLHPTRIPYANEVFRLTSNRFEKIMKKFNKIILTGLSVEERLALWPKLSRLVQKTALRRSDDNVCNEILQIFNSSGPNTKKFVPRYAKQWLNSKKGEKLLRIAKRVQTSRKRCKQVQLGFELKSVNRLAKYTAKRNFIGFTPYQRQLLKKPELERFKTCDLVGNDQGRTITKAVIHRDYQFLKILMDTSPENMRKNLFDSGLEERYQKFRKTLTKAENISAANEISVQDLLTRSKKEDSVLLGSFRDEMNNQNSYWSDFLSNRARSHPNDSSQWNPKTSGSNETKSRLAKKQSGITSESKTNATNIKTKQGVRGEPVMIPNEDKIVGNRSQNRNRTFQTTVSSTSIKTRSSSPEKLPNRSHSQTKSEARTSAIKQVGKLDFVERKKSVASGNAKLRDHSESNFRSHEDQPKSKSTSRLLQTDFDVTVSEFLKRKSNTKRPPGSLRKDVRLIPADIFAYPVMENVHLKQEGRQSVTRTPVVSERPSDSAAIELAQGSDTHEEPTTSVGRPSSLLFLSARNRNPSQPQSGFSISDSGKPPQPRDTANRPSQVNQGKLETSVGSARQIAEMDARRRLIEEKVRKLRGKSANSGAYKDELVTELSRVLVPRAQPSGQSAQIRRSNVTNPVHERLSTNKRTVSKAEVPVRISKPQLDAPYKTHSKMLLGLDSSLPIRPDSGPSGSVVRDITFTETPSSKSINLSTEIREESSKSKIKDSKPSKFQRVVESESSQSIVSMRGVSKGLPVSKSFSQLFPGKKILFGLDVGQGLRNVKFVKDNALGADEVKKQEMVKLLTGVKSPSQAAKQPCLSVEQSLTKLSANVSVSEQVSQLQYSPRTAKPAKSQQAPLEYQIDPDSPKLEQQRPIKTLDEIYKEAHGINKHNTPSIFVENSYEFESNKKQQLKKHRQDR